MIELRITNGPLGGHERIFRVYLSPDDLAEFIAFLDEYGLVANHIQVQGQGSGQDAGEASGRDLAEVPDVRPDPCPNCGSTEIEELPFEGFSRCKKCGKPMIETMKKKEV